jgi:hypothetical protein
LIRPQVLPTEVRVKARRNFHSEQVDEEIITHTCDCEELIHTCLSSRIDNPFISWGYSIASRSGFVLGPE